MSNAFKLKKISLAVASGCLAVTMLSPTSFAAVLPAASYDPDDKVASAADKPPKRYAKDSEYPEVFLLSELEKIVLNQQVCFISYMDTPQTPDVNTVRENNGDDPVRIWSAPAWVPETLKADPRMIVHASYDPVVTASKEDMFKTITDSARPTDLHSNSNQRFQQRVIFDFSERWMNYDEHTRPTWFDPTTLGDMLDGYGTTTYYRVCGKKTATRVVSSHTNPYWISPEPDWEGRFTISEIEVSSVSALSDTEYQTKLATRNMGRLMEAAYSDKTPEKVTSGEYSAADVQAAISDHRTGMHKGMNMTDILLTALVNNDMAMHKATKEKKEEMAKKLGLIP